MHTQCMTYSSIFADAFATSTARRKAKQEIHSTTKVYTSQVHLLVE
jgi:hypothetical protein